MCIKWLPHAFPQQPGVHGLTITTYSNFSDIVLFWSSMSKPCCCVMIPVELLSCRLHSETGQAVFTALHRCNQRRVFMIDEVALWSCHF